MYAVKNPASIMKVLESKSRRLEKIEEKSFHSGLRLSEIMANAHSYVSTTEEKCENFYARSDRASEFLEELKEVILTCSFLENHTLVSLTTIEKELREADIADISYDGTYCKIVLIQNCSLDDRWLIYVAPVESIL